jgi:aspartyl-tRNA(Asn)/glutamyl-tRNA(Gln) amidotransferase subunit C
MRLSKKEIEHIADLARLELSKEEVKKYRHDLANILKYMEMLKEVKTDKVEPTAQVSGLMDVFRDDKVENWDFEEVKLALSQGEREDGSIKVKRVL